MFLLRREGPALAYGCRFSLASPVPRRFLRDAQALLDSDRAFMASSFNEDLLSEDQPILAWRWALNRSGTGGVMAYGTARLLSAKELGLLSAATAFQAGRGIGRGLSASGWGSFPKGADYPVAGPDDALRKYLD